MREKVKKVEKSKKRTQKGKDLPVTKDEWHHFQHKKSHRFIAMAL
jgi:hypothetical protein